MKELKTRMGVIYAKDNEESVEIYDSDKRILDFIYDRFFETITAYQEMENPWDLVDKGIFENVMWNEDKEELIQNLKDFYEENEIEPLEEIDEKCINRIGNMYVCYQYNEL